MLECGNFTETSGKLNVLWFRPHAHEPFDSLAYPVAHSLQHLCTVGLCFTPLIS
jgi:hypothetical protein